jgi:hypothetical protein
METQYVKVELSRSTASLESLLTDILDFCANNAIKIERVKTNTTVTFPVASRGTPSSDRTL